MAKKKATANELFRRKEQSEKDKSQRQLRDLALLMLTVALALVSTRSSDPFVVYPCLLVSLVVLVLLCATYDGRRTPRVIAALLGTAMLILVGVRAMPDHPKTTSPKLTALPTRGQPMSKTDHPESAQSTDIAPPAASALRSASDTSSKNSVPKPPTEVSRTQKLRSRPKPSETSLEIAAHPYDMTDDRRVAAFVSSASIMWGIDAKKKAVVPTDATRDLLRIGCIYWSERACTAAGSFLLLLSQAGWKIRDNTVKRMDSRIPQAGISLCQKPSVDAPRDLPPHLGTWQRSSESSFSLTWAFSQIGLRVMTSSDDALESGELGVYFGPEPEHFYAIPTQRDIFKPEKSK